MGYWYLNIFFTIFNMFSKSVRVKNNNHLINKLINQLLHLSIHPSLATNPDSVITGKQQ